MSSKDDISDLTRTDINSMVYMPVPDHDKWRINMLEELINVKWGEVVIEGYEAEHIDYMINEISTS